MDIDSANCIGFDKNLFFCILSQNNKDIFSVISSLNIMDHTINKIVE